MLSSSEVRSSSPDKNGLKVSLGERRFDLVVVMAGTNDIGQGKSPEVRSYPS